MRRVIWIILGGVLAAGASCASLPYESDQSGFLVSAQANSSEFPVYLNGKLCIDMEGQAGLCSKRLRSNEDLTFRFDPQEYSYLLTLNCSTGLPPVAPATVPAKQGFTLKIRQADISAAGFRRFTCIGEINPQDRGEPVSAKFTVSVAVYDVAYLQREAMGFTTKKGKTYLVTGKYARQAWVFDQGKWTRHRETTLVQIKGPIHEVRAYSESYVMRFNFWNMSDATGVPGAS